MIGIRDAAYALGPQVETVDAWCAAQGRSGSAAVLRRHGVEQVHRASPLAQRELASAALQQLFERTGLAAHEVDVLVTCHTSALNTLPAPLCFAGELRRAAGLRRAVAFAVGQQQCVSAVHALRLVEWLFGRHRAWRHAVVLCADTVLVEAFRPLGEAGMHSDGASALLLQRDAGSRLRGLCTYNHPRPTRGILADGRYETDPHYLWALVSVVRQVARSAGLRLQDFANVLPHNVNLPAWRQALDALRIPRERLFERNFTRVGHTFGSDAAINLADSGALRQPGHHLVVASGIGGTFGGFALTTP
jgi:3-oxoacyl-[acyl-carrier-protein] synthase III